MKAWYVVDEAIQEQAKEERVDGRWMTKLLVHVYRHGYDLRSFRLWEDPSKGYIPLGLIALGFDAETLVKVRMRQFRVRLLKKIDEHAKLELAS